MLQVTTICLLVGPSYFKGLRKGVKRRKLGRSVDIIIAIFDQATSLVKGFPFLWEIRIQSMQVPTEKRKLRKELKLLFICTSLFLPQFSIEGRGIGTNAWSSDNQFSSSFLHLCQA